MEKTFFMQLFLLFVAIKLISNYCRKLALFCIEKIRWVFIEERKNIGMDNHKIFFLIY